MKKRCLLKAFTIIELMVSIFITITIIASFYKLYEASVRTERSSSIRVAVNLMGEQMLDTISESIRLLGLNSSKQDFTTDASDAGIIRYAGEHKFVYLSPFGSPITKVKDVSGKYPTCTFTLFNSASFYSGINKLYFHNQDGFFKTSSISGLSYSDDGVIVTTNGFDSGSYGTDENCVDIFPKGSMVTGEDLVYTLEYSASGDSNSLRLSYHKESVLSDDPANEDTLVNFSYDSGNTNNYYSMPKFVLEYLVEECSPTNALDCARSWYTPKGAGSGTSASMDKNQIRTVLAVRFGFVLLSQKERVYTGSGTPGDLPSYCIFKTQTNADYYCYQLPNLNYTASVFRRVIYFSNYRFMKDQVEG